jgi:hypothetical protein
MPLILAIEPDKRQAAQLKVLVKNRLRADLILADTTELALEAIGDRIPDLVLVPALLSPEEDGALNQALRVIAHAAHVQTLTIPVFAASGAKAAAPKTGGLLSKLLAGKSEGAPEGCDPAVFGDQIAEYLAEAAANRQRGFDDDDFEDAPARPTAASFTRVETFAPADSFQSAVAGFEDELTSNDSRRDDAKPVAASGEPSIFRQPEPPPQPAAERTSAFDSLFKRRERTPAAEPPESSWPVYEPDQEPAEEAPAPASDSDTDWAPPADQAIGVDLPPADEELPAYAASEPETVEQQDPVEDAVWAEHESDGDAEAPPLAAKWTPGAGGVPSARRRPADPAPADLLAEFTADLATTRLRPQQPPPEPPRRVPSPKTKPPVAARPAAPPPEPPKAKPQPAAKAAPPPPPPAPPAAAAPPPPAPHAAKPAPKQAASTVFKPKTERPEWTALIDSLRQDMERMRRERGGRSESLGPIAPEPHVPVDPVPVEEPPAPRAVAPAPAPAPPPVAAAPPQDRAAKPRPVAKRPEKKPTPVQDEWGFFDPQQCGFAALLAKLDEITDNEEKPA